MKSLPLGNGPSSQISCTVKLYVLSITGKKEKGDYGELTVKMWLSDVGDARGPGIPSIPGGWVEPSHEEQSRSSFGAHIRGVGGDYPPTWGMSRSSIKMIIFFKSSSAPYFLSAVFYLGCIMRGSGSNAQDAASKSAVHRLSTITGMRGNTMLPKVHQTSLGTLYEEPCVVYLRVREWGLSVGVYSWFTDRHAMYLSSDMLKV